MRTRDRIHELVEQLPDRALPTVERFLAELSTGTSPLRRALAHAPEEDEPLTPDEIAAIDEGYADIAAGRTVSDDELWRRLGHTPTRSPRI